MRRGSAPSDMRPLKSDDLFISRLKLLIIMSKAYLEGYPLGTQRAQAVIDNARAVSREITDWFGGEFVNFRSENEQHQGDPMDYYFFQRVKLLTVMAKGFAEGNPMGEFRKKAMAENLEHICNTLTFDNDLSKLDILQVA